uniref:ATP synthase F0 subunit 6 n=1 Tax=Trichoglossus haematodus TaxID=176049 RepID=UPI002114D6AB|nr:ATP synthase F0 subunit 6 [Trichoglossus haematodus]YP_010477895.1 ATP synthase F0 subunit 6 [Trichoglossus forsteni]YP_010477908.1 ATP synthase F0 subunit 6 [Trichoglossus moluccanus]YP_010937538.1 ATP synthase F0 subunit 6 [Trichoglossus euteles]QXP99672.1 ATP synthase F0 subunit 6 [Trichoglossus haematodus]UVI59247.1 ATP synthase F0 subunit 6 [Trichoglossus forsteni]UVI59260.1 ATP synthase F0 subunit 6 [Trichoglossus moluccanus]WKW95547.1 ATP synthase F0 subunit 6 [Trichoglossus eutele
MILTFFDQFSSPYLLGIPLILLSMLLPSLLLPTPSNRWITNRLSTLQLWTINTITKQLMTPLNKPGHKWALILTSLMTLLLMINLLGLLPYTFTPTTQLSMNMALALPLWLATLLTGLRNQPTASLGHLLPEGTPTPLIPALIMIETISLFIRPLALGVRLTANLTAGHLLIQLISTATITLLPIMPTVSILTATILLLLTVLEVAVAMIQAYVFVLLLSLYLQENI